MKRIKRSFSPLLAVVLMGSLFLSACGADTGTQPEATGIIVSDSYDKFETNVRGLNYTSERAIVLKGDDGYTYYFYVDFDDVGSIGLFGLGDRVSISYSEFGGTKTAHWKSIDNGKTFRKIIGVKRLG